jgi:hypothetical protein
MFKVLWTPWVIDVDSLIMKSTNKKNEVAYYPAIVAANGDGRHFDHRRSSARKLLLLSQDWQKPHTVETSNPVHSFPAQKRTASKDSYNFPQ